MQNSAISFSVCTSENNVNLNYLLQDLENHFKVSYNTGVSLLTIRHYNEDVIAELTGDKESLLEQRSRNTARFVLKLLETNATKSTTG
jgi:aspartate kinase